MSNARFSIIPSKAVKDPDLSDSVFRTLAALGIYGDENGWCWPSTTTLAEMLNKSRQAVSKDIKTLKEKGYLYVRSRHDEVTKAQKSNMYQIKFDTPPATPEVAPPETAKVAPPATPEVAHNDPLNDLSNAPMKSAPNVQQITVGVLAKATGLDYKVKRNAGRLARVSKELLEAGYVPDLVERAYGQEGWWYKNDWRGQKGEMPTPEQIVETIGRVDLLPKVNGHGTTPTRRIILPDGQIVEASGA